VPVLANRLLEAIEDTKLLTGILYSEVTQRKGITYALHIF